MSQENISKKIKIRAAMLLGIYIVILLVIAFACNKDQIEDPLPTPESSPLLALMAKQAIVSANDVKVDFDAVGIQCLGCTFSISGAVFPIDSARGIGNFIQYHVVDTRYNFKAWITFFNGNESVFFTCDYVPETNPCLGLDQIIFLEGLVKVGIIDANNNIAIFEPEGYIGTRAENNIRLIIDGEQFSITDPAVQFLIPDK